jgi:Mn-dependent DtxR family transcriptional regulator
MQIYESAENYLEAILALGKKGPVRSIDVAQYLEFSKPSVSRGVGLLKNANYITVDKNGFITLTEKGRFLAQKIYERHTVLTNALMFLGVDKETATEDACKIEHVISDKSFEEIKNHIKKYGK